MLAEDVFRWAMEIRGVKDVEIVTYSHDYSMVVKIAFKPWTRGRQKKLAALQAKIKSYAPVYLIVTVRGA